MKLRRIVVGLSGGVDSAVSAYLLKQQGHEVVGVFMKNWEDDDDSVYCSSNIDFVDAAAVADVLGIEIEHVNFAAGYKDRVFAEFLREYKAGRTPNPDVLCNAEIKFKAFLDHAVARGAEQIATGHYARVRPVAGNAGEPSRERRYELLKGLDPLKDQSYFLHRLTQAQLARTLFPVGELPKTEVRRIAAKIGLPNAKKKDSTGICFIGERPFREFLNRYLAHQPGPIKDDHGRTIGEHVGLSFYTLGQRRGIGIGGLKASGSVRGGNVHEPWFVARKEMDTNTLYAVQGHDHPWLLSKTLVADDLAWVAGGSPLGALASTDPSDGESTGTAMPLQAFAFAGKAAGQSTGSHAATAVALAAKTRYRQADAPCSIASDPTLPAQITLRFAKPQWAVTPGQSAVLYDGDICLGGGVISSSS